MVRIPYILKANLDDPSSLAASTLIILFVKLVENFQIKILFFKEFFFCDEEFQ
jgi:hypothetical protein